MRTKHAKGKFLSNLPLSKQLYYGVLLIAFISVMLTGYFVGIFYWNSFISLLKEDQLVQLEYATNDLNNWIENHLEALRFNSRLANEKKLTIQEQIDISNTLMNKYIAIKWISVFKPDSTLLYSVRQHNTNDIDVALNLPSFENAIKSQVESTGKIIYIDKTPMLIVYLPIIDENEKTALVLSAMIDLRYMAANINSINFNQYGYVYVLDETSAILSSNFNLSECNKESQQAHDYFFFLNNSSPKTHKGINGKRVISNFREIKTTQWFLVTEYPISMLMNKMSKNLLMMFIALLSAATLGLLGASIIYQNINKPLKMLTDSAEQISKGNYALNLKADGMNELDSLSKAFATMSEKLLASFEDIQHQLAYERMISEIGSLYIQQDSPNPADLQNQVCEIIGNFYEATEVLLYLPDPSTDSFSLSNHWKEEDIASSVNTRPELLAKADMLLLTELLIANPILFLSSKDANVPLATPFNLKVLSALEKDNNLFKELLSGGIESLICMPYNERNEIFGFQFLLFADSQFSNVVNYELQFTNLASLIETSIQKTINRKKLRETSEKLSITLNSIDDAVISADEKGMVNVINPVAEKLLGWKAEDIGGVHINQVFRLFDPETKTSLNIDLDNAQLPDTGNYLINYYYLVNRGGAEIPIDVSMSVITDESHSNQGIVITFRDISEKLRADTERVRIQKHEALGYLAAGIAHDFNNLLGTILGGVNLAQETIAKDDKRTAKILSDTEFVVMHGKDIAHQLFALNSNADRVEGSSNLLSDLMKMSQMVLYNTRVQPIYQLAESLPPVKLPDGTVNQIVTNLLINAAQAMPSGGEILIESKLITVDKNFKLPLEPGNYIQLNIIDKGNGIPKELLEKVFLPYYTTKETGTGLGIPTVLSLITMYGGYFRLESVEGEGTDAEVFFPVCE
ncbi:MAG: ATP-binding protein [Candidatus Cloacimonetes bacterium]|nr:ATP-binding protein [Candidatus Cloacimonadota bacterium]